MKGRTFTLLLMAFTFESLHAQCEHDRAQKILAWDGTLEDHFASSVALNGDVALVGAPGPFSHGGTGSCYIYRYDALTTSWLPEQKLLPSDGRSDDIFGFAVSLRDDVALIGAPWVDDLGSLSGAAYVFRYDGTTWIEEQKLAGQDTTSGDYLGLVVSIDGNVALVGAPRDDDGGNKTGSAYIFRFDGTSWHQEQKLHASDPTAEDRFGLAVSIRGDVAFIGARLDDDRGADSGSVYVFRYDSGVWSEEAKLTASDGAPGDWFGWSLDADGETVAIGAHLDDDQGDDSGSVYVFRHEEGVWNEEAKLTASDGLAGNLFGYRVALDDSVIAVGAPAGYGQEAQPGSTYIYRYDENTNSWSESLKLLSDDAQDGDVFGWTVDVDDDRLLVGATLDDDLGPASGSAYVFRIADLVLDATPQRPEADDVLTLTTCSGEPQSPVLLAVVEVSGTPTFAPLANGFFGSDFAWSFSAPVPSGLGGIRATFQSFGFAVGSQPGTSNRAVVDFE